MAMEAIQELTACPDMAMETIYHLIMATEATLNLFMFSISALPDQTCSPVPVLCSALVGYCLDRTAVVVFCSALVGFCLSRTAVVVFCAALVGFCLDRTAVVVLCSALGGVSPVCSGVVGSRSVCAIPVGSSSTCSTLDSGPVGSALGP